MVLISRCNEYTKERKESKKIMKNANLLKSIYTDNISIMF